MRIAIPFNRTPGFIFFNYNLIISSRQSIYEQPVFLSLCGRDSQYGWRPRFIEAGIPSVDIIDFDYPYWHTSQDTSDKTSADSLRIVGETVATWLIEECCDLGY